MATSLLQKAKAVKVERVHQTQEINKELLELAVAYTKHEITLKQAAHALEVHQSKAESMMRTEIMKAVRFGNLK